MADPILGTADNDILHGGDNNDTILGLAGHDELHGHMGRDTIEGGDGWDRLYGGGGNDLLIGGTGDDYLDGGQGADTLRGGGGHDTYRIDNVGDRIIEVGNGQDSVNSSISYVMEAGVDNLNLNGGNLDGTGNELDNSIWGTTGNNRLLGGAGNDSLYGQNGNNWLEGGDGDDYLDVEWGTSTMIGGAGNDYYEVEDASVTIIEDGGEDSVSIYNTRPGTYTVDLQGDFEYIWFGGMAMTVYGTDIDNNIMAGGGDNGMAIYGMGGNDYIESYQVGIIDGGDGDDEIWSYISADEGGNEIHGGNGNDVIYTYGGMDLITGGAGNDTFWLLYPDRSTTITDFSATEDLISFDGIEHNPDGFLDADHFYAAAGAGAVAQDENDHIIYDTASGALYWDADGNGEEAQFQFALLTVTNGTLTHQNFYNEWYIPS